MEDSKSNSKKLFSAARQCRYCLKDTLEKSKSLVSQIDHAGSKLAKINDQTLPFSIYTRKSVLSLVGGHVNRAFGPIIAVLRVCDSFCELENLLIMEGPGGDVVGYLSLIKQLEEVLGFLSDNCAIAVEWMEDVIKLLDENNFAENIDDQYILNLKTALRLLRDLRAMATNSLLNGEILNDSFRKLELEFRRIIQSQEPNSVEKLHAIIERLKAKNRLDYCKTVYIDVRSLTAYAALQALNLSYLEIPISELDSIESLSDRVVMWGKHMEFAVKNILWAEYKLCSKVFDKFVPGFSMDCFAKITTQSGFLALLKFGNGVTKAKKDAVKLMKLLDIFAILDKLRLDFNKLFRGNSCIEIRNLIRDLIKQVVDEACQIFCELAFHVEDQGSKTTHPPLDGGVPRFSTSIMNYCITLLQDDYRKILSQVLSIHQLWNQNESHNGIIRKEFHKIMKAMEINLETLSKTFEDKALSYFFLMNNYRYLHGILEGTTFGELMGEKWLNGYVQKMEYYAEAYLKDSWGKLPEILSEEGLMLFFPDRTTKLEQINTKLREFKIEFKNIYRRQSEWLLLDKGLREKACQLIVQAVIPAYRSYLHNYASLAGKGSSSSKYVKNSADSLEVMLRSLFQPSCPKPTDVIGRQSVSRPNHQIKRPKMSHSTGGTGRKAVTHCCKPVNAKFLRRRWFVIC